MLKKIVVLLIYMISTIYCAEDVTFETSIKNSVRTFYTIKALAPDDTSCLIHFFTSTIEPFNAWLPDFRKNCLGQITYSMLKKKAKIHTLGINYPNQKKGLGTSLILQTFDHMRAEGIKKVYWQSTFSALDFYKRFGARQSPSNTLFMKLNFDKDGDPRANLARYKITKKNNQSSYFVSN